MIELETPLFRDILNSGPLIKDNTNHEVDFANFADRPILLTHQFGLTMLKLALLSPLCLCA